MRTDEGKRGDLEFQTIPRMVAMAAGRHGDTPAIDDGQSVITYRQLAERVHAAAKAFVALGVAPGDRVAVWAPNISEWIVVALGAQAAGGVLVPVNTRYKGLEAAYILAKSQARVLVTVQGFLGNDYLSMLDACAEPTPALAHRVVLRGDVPEGALSYEAFLARGEGVSDELARARAEAVAPSDLADILFTSGTTGAPKGAMSTHAQDLRAYRDWADVTGLCAGERYLIVMPFFHSFGYKAGILAALISGCTILPEPVFDVDLLLRRVAEAKVHVLPGAPALYQSILLRPDLHTHDLSSLRLAVTGAASIPVSLVEQMRDVLGFETVITGYGMTEATGIATMCRHEDDPVTVATTSGRSIPGVEVRVVDAEGRVLPPGEAGEVLVRGYNVMTGYFDAADDTAEAIDSEGFFHTGDIGVLDERGYIRITDRVKDMFIVGGFNAYPAEIESTLLRHEDIGEVAVIGVPDARLGEVGVAFVVPRPGHAPTEASVLAWSRDNLANFKVPRRVLIVDSLPRNATGKVTKFVLRERLAEAAP